MPPGLSPLGTQIASGPSNPAPGVQNAPAWEDEGGACPQCPSGPHSSLYHLQPGHIIHRIQSTPQKELLREAQRMGETVLPNFLPGGTLISTGTAGYDVFKTARREYYKHPDMDPWHRVTHLMAKTGNVLLFHVIATLAVPALLSRWIYRRLQAFIAHHPRVPAAIARHPRWTTFGITGLIMLALQKPIDILTDLLLRWTYCPLVLGKKPDAWPFGLRTGTRPTVSSSRPGLPSNGNGKVDGTFSPRNFPDLRPADSDSQGLRQPVAFALLFSQGRSRQPRGLPRLNPRPEGSGTS